MNDSGTQHSIGGRKDEDAPIARILLERVFATQGTDADEHDDGIIITVDAPELLQEKPRRRRQVTSSEALKRMGILRARLSEFPSAMAEEESEPDFSNRENYRHQEFYTDRITVALAESFSDIRHIPEQVKDGYDCLISIPSRNTAYHIGNWSMLQPYDNFTRTALHSTEMKRLQQRLSYSMPEERIEAELGRAGILYSEMNKFARFNKHDLRVYLSQEGSLDNLVRAALPDSGTIAIHSDDNEIVHEVVEQLLIGRDVPYEEVVDTDNCCLRMDGMTVYFVGPAKNAFQEYATDRKVVSNWQYIDGLLQAFLRE